MAMIIDLGIPREEVAAIGSFLASEGEAGIPEVGEEAAKVLDVVTAPRNPNSLWRTVIGKFVEYTPTGTGFYKSPDGEYVKYTDVLMDEEGHPTEQRGTVVADHEDPTAAYVIGVPF